MTQRICTITRNCNSSVRHIVDIMDNATPNSATYKHRYLSVAKGVAKFIFERYPYEEPTNSYHAIMAYHDTSNGKSMAEKDADKRRKAIEAEEARLLDLLHKRRLSIKRYHIKTPEEQSVTLLWYFISAVALFATIMGLAVHAP